MTECLFCKLISGDIPADIVYQDGDVFAFRDISPQAPTHILVIPKHHIATINDVDESHQALLGKLVLTAKNIAKEQGLADDGYRLVMNCNQDGGQAVYHIHLHILGGRSLTWPPG
ncbi:histidine triad nucleotide-binding protein [Gammaproteobacteria bacterium AH-315-C21]|nr:histidine triad nucleotide-binding protein [Gammaproteobacteria bacterium AH-315-C21]